MTNLTEQKGKKTHYYIKLPNSDVFIGDEFALSLYRNCKDGDKIEVLDEVPSYIDWQETKDGCRDYKKLCLDLCEQRDKLKELLKGAKEIIEWYKADCGYRDIPTEVTLQHINQVLGEE